jgi:salicylate hydroxylase
MATEDAVVLAACVDLCGGNPEAAFRRYQEERYLRTGKVQITARYYGDVYHAAGVVRELRNGLFAGKAPDPTFASMAWLYDGIKVPA